MMISRLRRLAVVALIGAAVSTGLVLPSATASAAPVLGAENKYFNIHIRTYDGTRGSAHCVRDHPFGDEHSACDARGTYDDSQPAGFRNVNGGVIYDNAGSGGTYLAFYTDADELVRGGIPNRGSSDFTISSFDSPAFGTLARVAQKLTLIVEAHEDLFTGDRWFDFYLRGTLVVTTRLGDLIEGAFGSS